MRVKGLDGKSYSWYIIGYANNRVEEGKSSLHLRGRRLLHSLFPLDSICEEVPLPGSGGLTADFVLPQRKLIVETHGEQHYRLTPIFHGGEKGFTASKQRDLNKVEWAEINGMRLIALPFDEDDECWRLRLT